MKLFAALGPGDIVGAHRRRMAGEHVKTETSEPFSVQLLDWCKLRGIEVLALSAMIFDDIRSRWRDALGAPRLSALEEDLQTMVPGETFRLDVPGWFGT